MKTITLIALLLASFTVQAQDSPSWRDEEFSLELTYARRGVELLNRELRPVPSKDHVGAKFGYTHFFGRDKGRGDLGLGIELGFARRLGEGDDDTKTIGKGQVKLVWMNNAPDKKVRPGIKLAAGWFRDNFKDLNCSVGPGGGISCGQAETSETFGGGFFVDYGKGRRRVRTGIEYFTTSFNGQFQHNAEASVGFVF